MKAIIPNISKLKTCYLRVLLLWSEKELSPSFFLAEVHCLKSLIMATVLQLGVTILIIVLKDEGDTRLSSGKTWFQDLLGVLAFLHLGY